MSTSLLSRRHWIQSASLSSAAMANAFAQRPTLPGTTTLKKDYTEAERENTQPPEPTPPSQRVGFALVGVGRLTLEQLLPAFAECKHAKAVALVSGDRAKAQKVAREYGIPESAIYSYETYDRMQDNAEIQAVYNVLPNSMHLEYTVRAAKLGKHVLCEKPMGNSVKECEQMIDACKQANKRLMIAYRMQYQPHFREAQRMARAKELGALKTFVSEINQAQGNPDQWRLKKALAGGGALPDVGVYPLNAIRALSGEEPTEIRSYVYSTPGDPRFKEVEELCSFTLQFPSGLVAHCLTSYAAYSSKRLRLDCERGWIEMDPAYPYFGQRLKIGKKVSEKVTEASEREIKADNMFALEIDHMAQCVMQNRQPRTPGEEGLQDQKLMEAIYKAAETGRPVKMAKVDKLDAFRGPELPAQS